MGINCSQAGKNPTSEYIVIEKGPPDDVKEDRKNLVSLQSPNGSAENLLSALHADFAGHHPVETVWSDLINPLLWPEPWLLF